MRLWEQFDRIVAFDTETTGVDFRRDRIIEIGAVSLEGGAENGSMDLFIRLPEGRRLDPFITNLTGITQERLDESVLRVLRLKINRGIIPAE